MIQRHFSSPKFWLRVPLTIFLFQISKFGFTTTAIADLGELKIQYSHNYISPSKDLQSSSLPGTRTLSQYSTGAHQGQGQSQHGAGTHQGQSRRRKATVLSHAAPTVHTRQHSQLAKSHRACSTHTRRRNGLIYLACYGTLRATTTGDKSFTIL